MTRDSTVRFSETLWFKKGDADADAAASDASAERAAVDTLPIEDRYNDDGSVTRGDLDRYTLRSGMTGEVPRLRPPTATGTHVKHAPSEHELIAEMRRSRPWVLLAGLAVIAIVSAIAGVMVT
jgi:hypothetical protein